MAEPLSELHVEIETLESRHAEHPEGRYFVPLANAYRKDGNVEHAEALLREGLHRYPDYLSAHIVLGRCLADRGADDEAADEFRYVLSLDPQNLIALRTLGEIAAGKGLDDEARGWYEELLEVDPMNEEAQLALDSLRGEGASAEAQFVPGAAWWEPPPDEPAPLDEMEQPETEEFEQLDSQSVDIGEPLMDEQNPIPFADEARAEQVVTETIANLYARQGLNDRAADVYRELIRRRGGDAALEARLAEVESRAAASLEPAEISLEQPSLDEPLLDEPSLEAPRPEPESEAEAESEAGTYSEIYSENVPETYAEPEEDAFAASFAEGFQTASPREGEPGIAVYLRDLIGWRPAVRAAESAEGELLIEDVSSFEIQPADPEPVDEREPEPDNQLKMEGEEPFPWELPAAPEDAFSFDEAPPESQSAPEPAPWADIASLKPTEPEHVADVEPAAASGDDDLESFQAWLRSLKR